jgi:hypothetical protein
MTITIIGKNGIDDNKVSLAAKCRCETVIVL